MTYISPRATIEKNVFIGRNVAILGACHLEAGVIIEDNCVIGKPSRLQLKQLSQALGYSEQDYNAYDCVVDTPTFIGKNSVIHANSLIYSGVSLGESCMAEDHSIIRWDTVAGPYTKFLLNVFVGAYVKIGSYSSVSGIVGNDSVIGNHTSMFGKLLHAYRIMDNGDQVEFTGDDIYSPFAIGPREAAPVLQDYVTVGFNASVIGGVTIHERSYITSSSTVTKDVPSDTIVVGVNQMTPILEWQGALREQHIARFGLPDRT